MHHPDPVLARHNLPEDWKLQPGWARVHQDLLIAWISAPTQPTTDVGHNIRTDDRDHRVLLRNLPMHDPAPVLTRDDLPENWEIAAWLSPVPSKCKKT